MRLERELMRGVGPAAVLKLLENQEMYGYELVQSLASQTDGVLAMGQSTLYPMLYNLEAKALIKGVWRDAPSGRKRKYYRLTTKGKRQLASSAKELQTMTAALASLGLARAMPACFTQPGIAL